MTMTAGKSNARQTASKILGAVIMAATVYFLGKSIFANWNDIKNWPFRFDPFFMGLSLLTAFLMYVFFALTFRVSLYRLRYKVPFFDLLKIYLASQPVKYVPGKVALIYARAKLLKKHGIPISIGIYAAFIEATYHIMGSAALSAASLAILIGNAYFSAALAGLAVISGAFLLSPKIFYRITNKLFYLIKHEPVPLNIRADSKAIFSGFLFALTTFFFFGVSLFFFLHAMIPASGVPFAPFISIASLSWLLGVIILISPAGIGPREAVLFLFLKPLIGMPASLAFAAGQRLWTTAYDFLFIGLFLFLDFLKRGRYSRGNENP